MWVLILHLFFFHLKRKSWCSALASIPAFISPNFHSAVPRVRSPLPYSLLTHSLSVFLHKNGSCEYLGKGIPIGQVDCESNGPSSECVCGYERVEDRGLLTWFDDFLIRNGREVLDVVCEVHGVAEAGIKGLNCELP